MLKRLFGRLIAPSISLLLITAPFAAAIVQPQAAIAATTATTTTANQITFTYNSPSYPWTSDELASLQSWITQVYPVISDIMGQPSHSFTVNISKDPTIPYAGLYSSGSNELVLKSFAKDVVVHELTHAFRDDFTLGLSTWEEGMTRAVEIEVMTRLADTTYFDIAHGYPIDEYYDNTVAKSGVKSGSIFGLGDPALALTRYQLAGYAWDKALIENPNFLSNFNAALYANPTIASNEPALISTAASVQPTVEGQAFTNWYAVQGIFNTNPTAGCMVYQRVSQLTADFFCRDSQGIETPQAGATLNWSVIGAGGQSFGSGQVTTTSLGWATLTPVITSGYTGRLKLTVTATSATGTASDTSYRTAGPESGVFGVSTGPTTGTVTFSSASGTFAPFSVPVTAGAFSAPSLQSVRGTIIANFVNATTYASRTFTKDASAYSLALKPMPIPAPTITSGNNQSAKINTLFATRLGVKIVDAAGKPVAGVSVVFTAPSSGASGRFSGLAKVTVKTDSTGLALAPAFKANGTVGSYSVKATNAGHTVLFALKNTR